MLCAILICATTEYMWRFPKKQPSCELSRFYFNERDAVGTCLTTSAPPLSLRSYTSIKKLFGFLLCVFISLQASRRCFCATANVLPTEPDKLENAISGSLSSENSCRKSISTAAADSERHSTPLKSRSKVSAHLLNSSDLPRQRLMTALTSLSAESRDCRVLEIVVTTRIVSLPSFFFFISLLLDRPSIDAFMELIESRIYRTPLIGSVISSVCFANHRNIFNRQARKVAQRQS